MGRKNISDNLIGLTNFNLNLLTTFCLIYSTRSITFVSEILDVTPSSVSQNLQKLRLHFRDPLFIRHGNTISPTVFADDLYAQVEGVFDRINDLINPIPSTNRRKELVLYSPFPFVIHEIPKVLQKIKYEQLPYKIKYLETDVFIPNAEELLNSRKVDIIFSGTPIIMAALKSVKFCETEFVLACRKDNNYKEKSVSINQLKKLDFIGFINSDGYIKYIKTMSKSIIGSRNFVLETNSLLLQLTVISKTDSIAFMSKKSFDAYKETYDLRTIETLFPTPTLNVYITYRTELEKSKDFQGFLHSLNIQG
ncbi:LysR family transcriptional regulator [Lelliottia aquatilis]|uniref:LysR family transcriptional regulator n=1 Tax=Lelliottia aquatilis TaxID=2080838 RepID=UPI0015767D2B|nr:LysR family transcriptional regulator [Lelliottia aquatilis]NTZ47759.1 LysR family transcriptional regulator [Lelliottia aquatilis]